MPRKHNSAAKQAALTALQTEHAFAASVEALLRAKARVPATPVTGQEQWTREATITCLREIASQETPEEAAERILIETTLTQQ